MRASPPHGQTAFTNRRSNSKTVQREKLPWPRERPFRILSLDGGGIRGLYTSSLLETIEQALAPEARVGEYFDLIAGTSTGGIIAIGAGLRLPAAQINDLYLYEGEKIFPPGPRPLRIFFKSFRSLRRLVAPKFNSQKLAYLLHNVLGDTLFGDSHNRLVIPAAIVPKAEIAVFKTDHHPDYLHDHKMKAWQVARATSAAPTYLSGHEDGGHMFVDGGLWANNPIMIAVSEALVAFDVSMDQIEIFSVGTGNSQFSISIKSARRGMFSWRNALSAAMFLQTDNATAQAQLLLGPDSVFRIEPTGTAAQIDMDDWLSAKEILPERAQRDFIRYREKIMHFFREPAPPRNHTRPA